MANNNYRRKQKAILAFRAAHRSDLPPAVSCRIRTGYKLYDGTVVTPEVASARAYPLNQQPTPVDVYQTPVGMLCEIKQDDWFVSEDEGSWTLFDDETFNSLYEPASE